MDVTSIYYLINVTDMEGKNVVLLHKEVNSTIPDFRVTELVTDHVHRVSVAAASGERVGPSAMLFIKTSPIASMNAYIYMHTITSYMQGYFNTVQVAIYNIRCLLTLAVCVYRYL